MLILIAVDGSDCSTKAVEFIAGRTWDKDDKFIVLSVVEPIPTEFGVGYIPGQGAVEDRLYDESAEIAGKASAIIQTALPGNLVEVKVATGMVAETVCNLAELLDVDLIVMGSHGRKGVTHFLLGSVAEEVLKKSPCSVEIIKSKTSEIKAALAESKKEKASKK